MRAQTYGAGAIKHFQILPWDSLEVGLENLHIICVLCIRVSRKFSVCHPVRACWVDQRQQRQSMTIAAHCGVRQEVCIQV